MRSRAAMLLLLLLLVLPASAAAPLAHREMLPNGAVLLVAERPAIPIVVVRISVPGGSVRDPANALGLANLTADTITRGTTRRSGPELDRAIEFVGGSLEAGAGRDSATLSLSVLKKDLPLGLDLLAEGISVLPASLGPRALPLLHQLPDALRHDGFPRVPLGQSQAEHAVKLQQGGLPGGRRQRTLDQLPG